MPKRPTRLGDEKQDELVAAFERSFKYYKGWVFSYEYPGFLAYHQMGGPLSVFFTPDFVERGQIPIQVNGQEGAVLESTEVPYTPPERNGIPYDHAVAHAVFTIIRPWLEKYWEW